MSTKVIVLSAFLTLKNEGEKYKAKKNPEILKEMSGGGLISFFSMCSV